MKPTVTERDVEIWSEVRSKVVGQVVSIIQTGHNLSITAISAIVIKTALDVLAEHYPDRSVKRINDELSEIAKLGSAMSEKKLADSLADHLRAAGFNVKTEH